MTDSKTEAPAVTLTSQVVTTLVTSFGKAYTAARNSGSALADFCAAALAAKLPAVPAAQDVEAIVDGIAKMLEWSGTPRERQNKSEARAIILAHASLPEGITAFRTETGACGYHDAVKIARQIPKSGSAGAAVLELTAERAAKKADYDAGLTRALQTYYRAMQNSKRKDRLARMQTVVDCATALKLKIKTE
jgi:hypothetical protein